jgi:hypothetical protein
VRLAFSLFLASSLAACSWDWTVRSADGSDASTATDAGTDAEMADSNIDSATPVEASDCTTLLANVASTKASAMNCTLGDVSNCATSVADECGCGVFVGQTGSTASQNFANAVDDAKAAGCTTQCSGCIALPARGTCIESGASFICSPP